MSEVGSAFVYYY
ncbi:05a3ad54-ade2-4caa-82b7-c466d6b6f1aa [Thermothielavioides terrestris]|uniref:05a3ad54-ade2-4caa-82b7-c466d6b6f1aa n=1 Tax=Thermothielavioides terrestris TaxID=2587410 RepID=A0A3S4D6S6_9PEZI|nr:05a3ad54-ade2-4caa-82b7-c466d6b6f1aa [Thermothielavioides terrestris]